MERYKPKNGLETRHRVVGNLYLASSIQDAKESSFEVIEEQRQAIAKFPYRAQAMIDLRNEVVFSAGVGFFYIPRVRQKRLEHDRFLGISLTVEDNTGELNMRVPPKFGTSLERIELTWPSDIVVLGIFIHVGTGFFHLSHHLKGEIRDPKRTLGLQLSQEIF